MSGSSRLCLGLALFVAACDSQIVLGDSEASLPLAGSAGSGGSVASAGAGAVAGSAGVTALGGAGGAPVAGSAGSLSLAGSAEAPIGPPGELVWSTDHEVGDFSDWQRGGDYYGGQYEWGDVSGYVDIGVGRDGSNGVVASINSIARGETSGGVRMYRRVEPGPAYYSCWFRLEETHTVSDWWSIDLFHAVDDTLDLDNDTSLWDVRVIDMPDGELSLQFFDHDVMQGTLPVMGGRIGPDKWFEITIYLDYRPPNDTRLVVWLDDTQLFDMKRLHTAVQTNVLWTVGNGAAQLDPQASTLYLDDAAVHRAAAP